MNNLEERLLQGEEKSEGEGAIRCSLHKGVQSQKILCSSLRKNFFINKFKEEFFYDEGGETVEQGAKRGG